MAFLAIGFKKIDHHLGAPAIVVKLGNCNRSKPIDTHLPQSIMKYKLTNAPVLYNPMCIRITFNGGLRTQQDCQV